MPTVGALLAFPSVLVLEAFCCHLAGSEKKVLRESRAELFVTPGGMTSQLQLLDVCKLFKDRNKYSYQDWMRSGEQEVAATGRLKRTSPAVLCGWAAVAWGSIPEELVSHSFKKCGISNTLDGSENDFLWEYPFQAPLVIRDIKKLFPV